MVDEIICIFEPLAQRVVFDIQEKRLSATGAFALVKLLRGVNGNLLAVLTQTL